MQVPPVGFQPTGSVRCHAHTTSPVNGAGPDLRSGDMLRQCVTDRDFAGPGRRWHPRVVRCLAPLTRVLCRPSAFCAFPRLSFTHLDEYALADMDNRLFVSKHQLELPSREELQQFLATQLAEVSG